MTQPHSRILFVSNGHGEIAIVQRIAGALGPGIAADHLALVGGESATSILREVGPRRALPSGGLIAMGNVRNIARDIAGGLLVHTLAQLRFLRGVRGTYDAAIAVGDVFALLMTLRARARSTLFVGTAKSSFVAPYGPVEERVISRADAVFVRDVPTAQQLREHRIFADAANVIVDLYAQPQTDWARVAFSPALAVFPGSRESAYGDAVRLCRLVRLLARNHEHLGAMLSVAPGVSADRMAQELRADGWTLAIKIAPDVPFLLCLEDGREVVRAWSGPAHALLTGAAIVLGQAGTANEAAAAAGIPVVAYEQNDRPSWYRRRQIGLLGDALLIVRGDEHQAAEQIANLLADAPRRAAMGEAGRERMGPPGGAERIAAEIARRCG